MLFDLSTTGLTSSHRQNYGRRCQVSIPIPSRTRKDEESADEPMPDQQLDDEEPMADEPMVDNPIVDEESIVNENDGNDSHESSEEEIII